MGSGMGGRGGRRDATEADRTGGGDGAGERPGAKTPGLVVPGLLQGAARAGRRDGRRGDGGNPPGGGTGRPLASEDLMYIDGGR